MAFKRFEVKVDLQKGALGFQEKNDKECASFIQFTFASKY